MLGNNNKYNRLYRRQFFGVAALLPISIGISDLYINKSNSTMWVWRDRILHPERVGQFCGRNGIDEIFLYCTPDACLALLKNDPSALAALDEMRGTNRRIYAMVGEPDWSRGITKVPEQVAFVIELINEKKLFDGIHFDIEPHSLPEWISENSRTSLMMGLINFYKTIRSIAGNIKFDAAINPVYANSFIRSENFLDLILQHINTISIMSYRKGIDRAIQWALPTIEIAEKNDAGWRMGLAFDNSGVQTSWQNIKESEFSQLISSYRREIVVRKYQKNFLGFAYQDYDGLKRLLEKT
jgi:hypothetical protein